MRLQLQRQQWEPGEWKTILTTGNLFDVLGVPLTIGAKWPERQTSDRGIILNYGVWQRCFGGRSDVKVKTIDLDFSPGSLIHSVAAKS